MRKQIDSIAFSGRRDATTPIVRIVESSYHDADDGEVALLIGSEEISITTMEAIVEWAKNNKKIFRFTGDIFCTRD